MSPTLVIINSILAFHSPSVLSFHPSHHHTFHHSTCLHVLMLTCLCLGSGSGTGSSSGYTQAWLRGEGPSAHAHEGVRLADQSGWIAIGEGLLDDSNNQGVSRVRQVHMTNQCYHLISGSCSQSWQCWSNSLVTTAGRYSQQWQCLQCGILCCGGQVWTNQWPISPLTDQSQLCSVCWSRSLVILRQPAAASSGGSQPQHRSCGLDHETGHGSVRTWWSEVMYHGWQQHRVCGICWSAWTRVQVRGWWVETSCVEAWLQWKCCLWTVPRYWRSWSAGQDQEGRRPITTLTHIDQYNLRMLAVDSSPAALAGELWEVLMSMSWLWSSSPTVSLWSGARWVGIILISCPDYNV